MATIKEMAEKYTIDYCHELNMDEEGGAWINIPKLATDSYMAGANAVLEKVECYLNRISVDNHSDDDLEDLYDTLCEMVKNLKGE